MTEYCEETDKLNLISINNDTINESIVNESINNNPIISEMVLGNCIKTSIFSKDPSSIISDDVFDEYNFTEDPENLFSRTDRIMELMMFIDNDNLRNEYITTAENHNKNIFYNSFPDAGFDLFTPEESICSNTDVNKISFDVKCHARMICDGGRSYNTGFYMYPRSSLSKTSLRLANSVGIIDSGYRGDLIGAFDCALPTYVVNKHTRLVQICAPGLVPVYVHIVNDLGISTVRGTGGFGSTG